MKKKKTGGQSHTWLSFLRRVFRAGEDFYDRIPEKRLLLIVRYGFGAVLLALGIFLGMDGETIAAPVIFFLAAVLEVAVTCKETGHFVDLRNFLTLSWLGGIGLSCLKFSFLQSDWALETWLGAIFFYLFFLAGYDLFTYGYAKRKKDADKRKPKTDGAFYTKRLRMSIYIVFFVSTVAFLLEAALLKFRIPLFVLDTPHAYTSFHITGLHYFVVSTVFLPVLTLLYTNRVSVSVKEKWIFIGMNVIGLLIPVLLLSKLQIFMFFFFGILIWLLQEFRIKGIFKFLGGAAVALVVFILFSLAIAARHYPDGYLESLFGFRVEAPVSLQYVYTYITNNFENLNLLVQSDFPLTFGLRSLYPFFCLTGLKFVPSIAGLMASVQNMTAVTIPELTTVTILYDVMGDFGIAGTVVLGAVLGAVSSFATRRVHRSGRFAGRMLYTLLAFICTMSFFTTWLSNPTIWYYAGVTAVIALFCKEKGKSLW